MSQVSLTSIVLPVHNQADHIERLVSQYRSILENLPGCYELVLVPNRCSDGSERICAAIAERAADVSSVVAPSGGWGRAVRTGLASSRGSSLCYANSARTTPQILALMLAYSSAFPNVVLKANRRIRDNAARRLGSLLYNLECRALFDLPVWDINGTPKIFPRRFSKLLGLTIDDDLFDLEFAVVCAENEYPIIEIPLLATVRHGGRSTTGIRSAVRMYRGAARMRRERRPRSSTRR